MSETNSFDWQQLKQEWLHALHYLKDYLKNPIEGIRRIPKWDWRTLATLQAAISAIVGVLAGVVEAKITSVIIGMIFLPISSLATLFVVSGFFYYFFLFIMSRQVEFKALFTLVMLANIPFHFIYILHSLLPPVTLLGLAVSCLLLIVGFVDYFAFPKNTIIKLVGAMFLVYFIMWVVNLIEFSQKSQTPVTNATQESLDILEKELQENP